MSYFVYFLAVEGARTLAKDPCSQSGNVLIICNVRLSVSINIFHNLIYQVLVIQKQQSLFFCYWVSVTFTEIVLAVVNDFVCICAGYHMMGRVISVLSPKDNHNDLSDRRGHSAFKCPVWINVISIKYNVLNMWQIYQSDVLAKAIASKYLHGAKLV